MRSCEVEQVFSNLWDCVAEWSRALVLGSSHFNDVGSSSTTARVQVSAEYVTFFQFLLRWSAHFTPQFYIFMSTEDICIWY